MTFEIQILTLVSQELVGGFIGGVVFVRHALDPLNWVTWKKTILSDLLGPMCCTFSSERPISLIFPPYAQWDPLDGSYERIICCNSLLQCSVALHCVLLVLFIFFRNLRHYTMYICSHFCNVFVKRLFFFELLLDASHFLLGHFLKVMV